MNPTRNPIAQWLQRFLGITHLEHVMTLTQDAIARNTASTNALLESVQTELKQVADGLAGTGDQANADAINALSDKLDAAKVTLDADDAPAAGGAGAASQEGGAGATGQEQSDDAGNNAAS